MAVHLSTPPPNECLYTIWGNINPRNRFFSNAVYCSKWQRHSVEWNVRNELTAGGDCVSYLAVCVVCDRARRPARRPETWQTPGCWHLWLAFGRGNQQQVLLVVCLSGMCLVVGDRCEPCVVSAWVAAGGSMLTDVRRGRSLCDSNALSGLMWMQYLFINLL